MRVHGLVRVFGLSSGPDSRHSTSSYLGLNDCDQLHPRLNWMQRAALKRTDLGFPDCMSTWQIRGTHMDRKRVGCWGLVRAGQELVSGSGSLCTVSEWKRRQQDRELLGKKKGIFKNAHHISPWLHILNLINYPWGLDYTTCKTGFLYPSNTLAFWLEDYAKNEYLLRFYKVEVENVSR